jgi:hypothetical protein
MLQYGSRRKDFNKVCHWGIILIIKICSSVTALVDTTSILHDGVLNGFLSKYRIFLNKYLLSLSKKRVMKYAFHNKCSCVVNVTVFDVIKEM